MTACCTIDLTSPGSNNRIVLSSPGSVTLKATAATIPIRLTGQPISLVARADVIRLSVNQVGVQGVSTDTATVQIQWSTPSAESGNAIEIVGNVLDAAGSPLNTSLVDCQIVVSDGANTSEPSDTATITAAVSPVGTTLAGSGTATVVMRSDNGLFKISVQEPNSGHRFLWITGAGHEQKLVRAKDGILELVFA